MTLLEYITAPQFISCVRIGNNLYRITMQSIKVDGKYYTIDGKTQVSANNYLFDLYNKINEEDLSESSDYLSKYLALGNQQEDEDGSI